MSMTMTQARIYLATMIAARLCRDRDPSVHRPFCFLESRKEM